MRPVALTVLAAAVLWPASSSALETMRIHMGDADEEVTVSGLALGFGLDGEDAHYTQAPGGRSVVRLRHGRLEIDGAPWPEDAVRFRAGEGAHDAGVPGEVPIRANGFEVRGDVVVRVHRGRAQLINVIPLEDYLVAVLGSEMPRSFPEEALKAQAVAARTYALQKKLEQMDAPFHLGSSVIHQVYGGTEREHERTRAAVGATRGLVVTFDLQPIEAYFHASCGGRTEEGAHALGRDLPYLRSVDCPCGGLPASRWEATVPLKELRRALGLSSRPEALSIVGRTRSGRVTFVDAGRRTIDAVTLRRKVGYTRIKSLSFELTRQGDGALHFTGRGYGHGAGMCQWGAKALADEGRSFREIIAHYYPGTELQHLY